MVAMATAVVRGDT